MDGVGGFFIAISIVLLIIIVGAKYGRYLESKRAERENQQEAEEHSNTGNKHEKKQPAGEKYCPNCEQYVSPEKEFPMRYNGGVFSGLIFVAILGFLFGGPAGAWTFLKWMSIFTAIVGGLTFIFAFAHYSFRKPECPICGTENLWDAKELYENSKEQYE